MNPYLEKVASLEKRAFDTDFETETHYGIAANRSIGSPDVIGSLRKAAKSNYMKVSVSDDYGNDIDSSDKPKFEAILNHISDKVEGHGGWDPSNKHSMNWDRDHVWAMSMDKNHPKVRSQVGKEDEWGEEQTETSVIADHVHSFHK